MAENGAVDDEDGPEAGDSARPSRTGRAPSAGNLAAAYLKASGVDVSSLFKPPDLPVLMPKIPMPPIVEVPDVSAIVARSFGGLQPSFYANAIAAVTANFNHGQSITALIQPGIDAINAALAPLTAMTSKAINAFLDAAWPPNLRGLDLRIREVGKFLETEGIPLYLVPRASTAQALLWAPDTAARRAIIGRRFDSILDDCDAVLDQCISPDTIDEVMFVRAASKALRDGHLAPGQALAANVLDSMMHTWFEDVRVDLTSHRKTPNGDVLTDEMSLRTALVMLPI